MNRRSTATLCFAFALVAPQAAEAGSARACSGPFIELGNSAHGSGVSGRAESVWCQRLIIDRAGAVFSIWADGSFGTYEVYLRKWDRTAWVGLGGSDVGGGLSRGTGVGGQTTNFSCPGSAAFDSLNRPYVVWMNYNGSAQPTHLRRWNGSVWESLAGSGVGGGVSGMVSSWWPTVQVDALDQVTVFWSRGAELYARRFETTAWREMAGSATSPGLAGLEGNAQIHASTSAGPQALPVVAWPDERHGVDAPEIHLLAWNGAAWNPLANSDDADGGLGPGLRPSVANDGLNTTVVAWEQSLPDGGMRIQFTQWNGVQWRALPSPITAAGKPALAFDSDRELFVAFELNGSTGTDIRLAHWTGSAWEACPLGFSDNGRSTWPELAVGPDGGVAVGWFEEITPGTFAAYMVANLTPQAPDAGGSTVDGGESTVDGGEVHDGGASTTRATHYQVGCGCSAASVSWSLLLFVLGAARVRTRSPRTRP